MATQYFITILIFTAIAQIIGGGLAWLALKQFKQYTKQIVWIEVSLMFAVSALLIYEGAIITPIYAIIGLLLGFVVIHIMNLAIPHKHGKETERLGTLAFTAMSFHEFPEGLAYGAAFALNPVLGIATAGMIAAHNLPEGAIVSIPYLIKKKISTAMQAVFATQVLYVIGGLTAYYLLLTLSPAIQVGAMCIAAGAMIYIGLEELRYFK